VIESLAIEDEGSEGLLLRWQRECLGL